MSSAELSVHLVVDVADDTTMGSKSEIVHGIVQRIVAEIKSCSPLTDRVRLSLVGFTVEVHTDVRRRHVDDPELLFVPVDPPEKARSYIIGLRALCGQISDDLTARRGEGTGATRSLALFVTDGQPTETTDAWAAELVALQETPDWPQLVPIGFGAVADLDLWALAGLCRDGADTAPVADPAATAAAVLRRWLADCATTQRPAAIIEDQPSAEWRGAFQPFTVGDPGHAAATVRAIPDPMAWSRPDIVIGGARIGDHEAEPVAEVRAASVRGLAHRFYGTVRQDDYAYLRTTDGRYLVAAVADGVSSGRLSHHAAADVAVTGCSMLSGWLSWCPPESLDWSALSTALADLVVFRARQLLGETTDGDPPTRLDVAAHMATTAMFAVMPLRADGTRLPVYMFGIGDSSAWILRGGRRWESPHDLTIADDVASSLTAAIPVLPDPLPEPVTAWLEADDVLVLMSDGIGNPLGAGTGPVGRFLATHWQRPPSALEFAAHVDFARRSHDDDRTAVAIWRHDASHPSGSQL